MLSTRARGDAARAFDLQSHGLHTPGAGPLGWPTSPSDLAPSGRVYTLAGGGIIGAKQRLYKGLCDKGP